MWRYLLIVAVVAALVRWASPLPLIITNDGVEYLLWAQSIHGGMWLPEAARPDRTPGYPALLACWIALFGSSAPVIQNAQHALGVAACLFIALAAGRIAGRRAALVTGLLSAIDPYLLTLECYVLSETLAVSIIALCATLLAAQTEFHSTRPPPWGKTIGFAAASAALLLTRPAFQVFVPFLVAAWILASHGDRFRGRFAHSATLIAVLIALLTPWLAVNAERLQSPRLASGGGAHFWSGVARAGLLDDGYELPPDVAAARRETLHGAAIDDTHFWEFLKRIDALTEHDRTLRDWAIRSVAARPSEYAFAAGRTFLQQLNLPVGPPAGQRLGLDAMMQRITESGRTFQADGSSAVVAAFVSVAEPTAMQRHLRSFLKRRIPGVPQCLMFLGLIIGAGFAMRRRCWPMCYLFGGAIACVLLHAAMLMPDARYSLPVLPLGWIAWAYTLSARRRPEKAPETAASLTA